MCVKSTFMIYIASDHAGFQLKKHLTSYLKSQLRQKFEDLGPEKYDENDDFPDFSLPLAKKVVSGENFGILICGTGHGMCISANKVKGVRAILGYSIEAAEWSRKHNNANILCLAGKILSNEHAAAIVKKFLETKFDGSERLVRRNKKIADLEK